MFTRLKRSELGYLSMAAIASLALAALMALFTTKSSTTTEGRANHENEQVINGDYSRHSHSTVRFIN